MKPWKYIVPATVMLIALGLPRFAAGDAVQASQSDQFVDSIGVAVHLNYSPEDTSWATLEPLLTGLGVRHIRDGLFNTGSATTYNPEFVDLSVNHGIQATLVMDYKTQVGVLDPTQIAAGLTYLQNTTFSQYGNASLLSAVESIEGPNEYDLECPGGTKNDQNWVGELTTYQQDLYNDVRAISAFNSVTLVGPSMGLPENQVSLPNLTAMVDTGNDHPYPGTGDVGFSTLDDYLTDSQVSYPALPLQITEDGYETNPNSGDNDAVTEAYQGIMEPHVSLENFRRGVKRTFLYDFVDEGTSTDTNGSHHFGLVENDSTSFPVKPAYTSIKNLISILGDAGSAFTPSPLGFNLSGSTNDVHTLLLQKRNGQFYLVLWLETTNTSASQSVAVTFDDWMGTTAYLYYPCTSSTANSTTLSNNGITLPITAQPTILRVYPNAPNGSLLVDDLADLSETSSYLDWKTLAATPTQWLGRTTEAERTAANGNNDIVYSSVDIRNFTALVGFGWNTTNPDGVTYAFSKLQLFASPDGSAWTSVPSYVGEIDKAATSAAQASARWLVPVSPSGPLPAGTNYVKFVVNSTDGVGLPQLFQMNIRQSGVLEAESMSQITSGATTTTVSDANASGGSYVQLNATGTGQYVQFTTPTLPPGTYTVWLRYCRQPNNGIVGFMVDSTNLAGAGENGTAGQYAEANRGSVTFTTAGTHTLRFTVTGTATSGYDVNADRVVFQQTSP